jgi:putative membrane protein
MDFSWLPYMSGFWIFPLFCLLFMAIMMIAGCGMWFRFGHRTRLGNRRETAREILERRFASGEIGKDQYDAMRHDLSS